MVKKKVVGAILIAWMALMIVTAIYFLWAADSVSTSYEPILASDVVLGDKELSLTLDCTDSAHLFRGFGYDIVNHTLYLTVRHGPSLFRLKSWPVQVHIRDEALNSVRSVYLRDGKSAQLVDIVLPFQKGSGASLLPTGECGDAACLPARKGGNFSWL